MSEIHGTLNTVTVTMPKVSERAPIYEYLVRYVIVHEVDGQGETCEYCHERDIRCNIYVTPIARGSESYAQACALCPLDVVDGVLDTDPAHVVTIERLA